MGKLHRIIRLKDVGPYLGLKRTQVAALIERGLINTFQLSPGGRAKGVTEKSLIEYQQRVMGLSHQADEITEPSD